MASSLCHSLVRPVHPAACLGEECWSQESYGITIMINTQNFGFNRNGKYIKQWIHYAKIINMLPLGSASKSNIFFLPQLLYRFPFSFHVSPTKSYLSIEPEAGAERDEHCNKDFILSYIYGC